MADRPISDWLAEPDDAEHVDPTGGTPHRDAIGAEGMWRPRPEAERTRRLWRVTALAWVALGILVGLLAAAGRLADAEAPAKAPAEEAAWRAEPGEDAGVGADGSGATVAAGAADDDAVGAPQGETGGPEEGVSSAAMQPLGEPTPGPADSAVTAAAALGVRLALTSDGDPARYVDLVAPEAVEQLGDLAIVTMAVVLLEGSAERWESIRPARYAVAVGTGDGGPRVLGTPWPLPGPASELAAAPEAEVVPLDDEVDAAAVLAALVEAGYEQPAVSGALPGAPQPALRVRVHAVAPGEEHAATHDVWLDLGGPPRVLGTWTSS